MLWQVMKGCWMLEVVMVSVGCAVYKGYKTKGLKDSQYSIFLARKAIEAKGLAFEA
jgi:hypothetical protein